MLRDKLAQIWGNIQCTLFPMQEEEIGPISEKHKKLISIENNIVKDTKNLFLRWVIGRPIGRLGGQLLDQETSTIWQN